MSERDRRAALTTACDDLQAQLEAVTRSVRHLVRDVTVLSDAPDAARALTQHLAELQRHLDDLRSNVSEEWNALRGVRVAAYTLSASVDPMRGGRTTLAEDKQALERTHAALQVEHARLRRTPSDRAGHAVHAEHLRDHLIELREFKKRLPVPHHTAADRHT